MHCGQCIQPCSQKHHIWPGVMLYRQQSSPTLFFFFIRKQYFLIYTTMQRVNNKCHHSLSHSLNLLNIPNLEIYHIHTISYKTICFITQPFTLHSAPLTLHICFLYMAFTEANQIQHSSTSIVCVFCMLLFLLLLFFLPSGI